MSDVVMLITAFSGLLIAIGTLVISIGVYMLVSKIGDAIGGDSG